MGRKIHHVNHMETIWGVIKTWWDCLSHAIPTNRPGPAGRTMPAASGPKPFAAAGRRRTAAAWGRVSRHGGWVLPDALPALTSQRHASVRGWGRGAVDAVARATHLSSSSPCPPAAPRVPAPLGAAHPHVFVVHLTQSILRHHFVLHPHCADCIVVRRRPALSEAAPQR